MKNKEGSKVSSSSSVNTNNSGKKQLYSLSSSNPHVENMNDELYDQTMEYLRTGNIPEKVTSTRSNFIAKAKKYKINKKQFLTRYGKLVVRASMELKLWVENHKHSGRIACWERIKKR